MKTVHIERNGVDRGPPRTTWLPSWLDDEPPATPPAITEPATEAAPVAEITPILPQEAADSLDPDDGPPCPQCGSIAFWWDLTGGRHCMTCEAAGHRRNVRLLERAKQIRSKRP